MPNDTVHVDDIIRFRSGDAFRIVDTLLTVFQRYKANNPVLGVEDGQIWKSISALFFAEARRRGIYPTVELLRPLTDKQARARPLQGRMQMHMVTFQRGAAWLDKTTEELLRFPTGIHDDIVDALAWMMQLVVTKSAPMPLALRRRSKSQWFSGKTTQERILEHLHGSKANGDFMSS
jgi:predicted phage terminase large subunit-like protein